MGTRPFFPLQHDVASNDRNVGSLDSQAPVMCLFVCLKRKYLSMPGTQGHFFALTECFLPAESFSWSVIAQSTLHTDNIQKSQQIK